MGGTASESNSIYAGMNAPSLNSNLVLLYHLNETAAYQYVGGDFNDFSGLSNLGVQENGSLSYGALCLFGLCAGGFSGPYIESTIPDNTAPNTFTTSLWYRFSATQIGGALIQHTNGSNL